MNTKRQVLVSLVAVGGLALLSQYGDVADGIVFDRGVAGTETGAAAAVMNQRESGKRRLRNGAAAAVGASAKFTGLPTTHTADAGSADAVSIYDGVGTDPRAVSPNDKMSGPVAALAELGGPALVDIVVRYDRHPELFDDERIEDLGGKVLRSYTALEMRAVRIPAAALESLALEDGVDWLSLDTQVHATSIASREAANVPAVRTVNAGYTGAGVRVALIDSGVGSHPDIAGSVEQYSFLNGANPQPFLIADYGAISLATFMGGDDFGHGTHVAGLISGTGSDSNGDFEGTAKAAKIVSLQVLNSNGGGQLSDVIAALDWLLVYGESLKIRVANISLGMSVAESNATDPLVLAVERLWDAGIVVVVAAGNGGAEGNFTISSPGNSRKVITVGSLTDNGTGTNFADDYVSTFSSVGPTAGDFVLKPDLVAPGNRLVAPIPSQSWLKMQFPSRVVACTARKCSSEYLELSGTSMAAPLVTAAAARMLEQEPTLNPATVKARLMRSARKLDAEPTTAGAGTLDIDAALNEIGYVAGEALSPLMMRDEISGGILVQDTAELWGDAHWSAGFIFHGGFDWTDGYDAGVNGEIDATGYLWTDGSVWAKGYLWTDGNVRSRTLFMNTDLGMVLNDDAPTAAQAAPAKKERR